MKLLLPLFVAVLFSLPGPLKADSPADQAARLYEQGSYAEALKAYDQLISSGADNGHMFYNKGNVQFRLGQYGAAIASYRRALLQLPRDPDVRANLALARKRAKGGTVAAPDETVLTAFLSPAGTFSHGEWVTVFLLLYLLFWGVFLMRRLRPWDGATSVLLVLGALLAISALYAWGTQTAADGSVELALFSDRSIPAVVLNDGTKVYSGDSEKFQVIFMLDQGAEVKSEETRGPWTKIALNGRNGWVHSESIEEIR